VLRPVTIEGRTLIPASKIGRLLHAKPKSLAEAAHLTYEQAWASDHGLASR
jgi:hypothetical protein